jgi:hypothetical protein
MGRRALVIPLFQDTNGMRHNPWYGWLSPTITKSRHSLTALVVWLYGEGVFEFFHPRFQ